MTDPTEFVLNSLSLKFVRKDEQTIDVVLQSSPSTVILTFGYINTPDPTVHVPHPITVLNYTAIVYQLERVLAWEEFLATRSN